MNNEQNHESLDTSWIYIPINGLLMVVTLILGVITLFAMQEIIITLVVPLVITPGDITIREKYALVTVRNIWLFCGGILLLGFVIFTLEYYTRRLTSPKIIKLLMQTLAVQLIIIAISFLI